LLLVATWQLGVADRGLEIIRVRESPVPVVVIQPKESAPGSRPAVLVAHGFAGSEVLMRGFSLTLAHAGYTVIAVDLTGHGRNPRPLPPERGDLLLDDAQAALATATSQGLGDGARVALLGHSMGSGVVLQLGQDLPSTAATIAVSPAGVPVTPELPQRLLLMAGQLEGRFVDSARALLAQAGGEASSVSPRRLVIVPGVEHISILFSPTAHTAARQWLDTAFGPQPGARTYVDRRLVWYGLGLLGMVLLGAALAPVFRTGPGAGDLAPDGQRTVRRSLGRRAAALIGGALLATLYLWLAGTAGLNLRALLGLQVAGYLLVWFALAGSISLLILWVRPPAFGRRDLLAGLVIFALLWLVVGLLGQRVWLSWWLVPRRLLLWPLGAALLLPWFLAVAQCSAAARWPGRLGWWLVHSLVLGGATFLALWLTPGLGFLLIVLPLFPLVLLLHTLTWISYRQAWAFALSGALFVSWLLLSVFPLVGGA
jgi:pimeloyl-ACP methyl ester carboxylesterase